MRFTQICVLVCVTGIISLATLLIGVAIEFYKHDEEISDFVSWLISTIGFGVCLTIILYQNGVIR